jgi:hypothetical protein
MSTRRFGRGVIDNGGTQPAAECNALARIHPAITDLTKRIKAERPSARRSHPSRG